MQRNFLRLAAAITAVTAIVNWSCSKVDTTTIGEDLIPAIDNLHTFADTFNITTTQGAFNLDSTYINFSDNHVIGQINNDPVFGKTETELYVDLKPTSYPYYFGNKNDTISRTNPPGTGETGYDSAFICLAYKGFYGDTTVPQSFTVYQMNNAATHLPDSAKINYQPSIPATTVIGTSGLIDPRRLKDSIFISNGKIKVANQIRIKLDYPFLAVLKNMDSIASNPGFNAFYSDSAFKSLYNGFVIKSNGAAGNGLYYINLNDPKTRLEVHYRRKNAGKLDTTFSSFQFYKGPSSKITNCGSANYINRNTTGAEFNRTTLTGAPNALYIQTTPYGSFIHFKIPQLDTFSNCIIHRAELFIDQIPEPGGLEKKLPAPSYLVVDIKDTTAALKYKPMYYDLRPTSIYNPDDESSTYNFLAFTGIDFGYYGGTIYYKTDRFGNTIATYNFNLSRYVQHIVTNKLHNYELRLSAPYNFNYYGNVTPFANTLGYGRLKFGDGNNPDYRFKMRVVYTKL